MHSLVKERWGFLHTRLTSLLLPLVCNTSVRQETPQVLMCSGIGKQNLAPGSLLRPRHSKGKQWLCSQTVLYVNLGHPVSCETQYLRLPDQG